MKTFYIFDHFLLPTPYNHRFFVEKFARGFLFCDYEVKVVQKISDIQEPGFVMITNHPFYFSFGGRSQRKSLWRSFFVRLETFSITAGLWHLFQKVQFSIIKKLAKQIAGKHTTLVAWCWNEQEAFFKNNNIPVIFTGEFFFKEPLLAGHKTWQKFYLSAPNAFPIKFSADIDPSEIGNITAPKDIFLSYVGNRSYKPDWYGVFSADRQNKIVPTPPYISESERLDIYKRSKINLGLHAEDNIKNGVVVERVFEALAFGAVCITDNPAAHEATAGAAVVVSDLAALKRTVDDLKDETKRLALVEKGLAFAKQQGTYYARAKELIKLAEKLSV